MIFCRGTWGRRLANLLIIAGCTLLATPILQRGASGLAQTQLRAAFAAQSGRVDVSVIFPSASVDDNPAGAVGVDETSATVRSYEDSSSRRPDVPVLATNDPVVTATSGANETVREPFAGVSRLLIPDIDVDVMVVDGVSDRQLAKGPGFYPEGSLPDQGGNVAIAGHRTTYGAWFRHVDRLTTGDAIYLMYDGKVYRYVVERVWAIAHDDWSVIAPTEKHVLTLTTCHPPGSSRYRLAVRAVWTETVDLRANVT